MGKLKYGMGVFILSWILILVPGCTGGPAVTKDNGKLNVVTTIFPYYDFVRQVAGDKVNLRLAIPAGMDTHSFEPTASDMVAFSNADIVIYNGGEMEIWVDEVLEASSNNNVKAGKMMDYIDVVTEEEVNNANEKHGHNDEEEEYDEHIWTSPVNACKIISKIADILSGADVENTGYYKKNADKYIKMIKELDKKFREVVNSSKRNYLLFADRFPLRYFVDEYKLGYGAAFAGCSSEIEPGADVIAFLADKARDEDIHVILKIELTSSKVAEAIAETAGAEVMTFNTCHNVTKEQFDKGVTYYDLMKGNLDVLKKALL